MFAFFAGLAAGLLHVLAGPDHLAAVAPLALSERPAGDVWRGRAGGWRTGLQWGVGHTAGVLLIAALLLFLKAQLPLEEISGYSERLVGAALIALGAWGLRGAWVRGADIPGHTHTGASFAMGTLHGLAGSSHLFGVLPALAFSTRADSLVYLVGFGVGAVVGMSAFTAGLGLLSTRLRSTNQRGLTGLLYASSAAAIFIGGFWLVGS